MSYKNHLAALLLTTALVAAPCLSGATYANDGWDKSAQSSECRHGHFSDAQRKLVHETMHRLHEQNKPVVEDMHRLRKSLHNVLAADNFDKKAFLSITAQLQAKKAQLARNRVQAFASIAGQFTPEERQHLMRIFRHHHHRGMRHGDDHNGWREGWQHRGEPNDGINGGDLNQTTMGVQPNNDYPPYAPR